MSWPFEHWDNGVCYFHHDNWNKFESKLTEQYPHNEDHRRICFTLISPRDKLGDVPCARDDDSIFSLGLSPRRKGHEVDFYERDFSVIFDVYPRWWNPHSLEPSWIMFAEDGHKNPLGEKLVIYSNYQDFKKENAFAFFRNQYWLMRDVWGGFYGPHPNPNKQKKKRKFWTIDELTD